MILEKSLSPVRMSTWLKLTGVLALVIGLAFFNGAGGGSVVQGPKYTFHIVVYKPAYHPYLKEALQDLLRGAKEADEVHPDLQVIYSETESPREFEDLVRKAIAAKPDGLIVTLHEFYGDYYHLIKAAQLGIPVLAVGVMPMRDTGRFGEIPEPLCFYSYFYEYGVSCVGEDPYLSGVRAAEEALKRFTPERAFFVALYPIGHIIADYLRMRGFQSTMWAKRIPVKIVAPAGLLDELKQSPEGSLVFITSPSFVRDFIKRAEEAGIKIGPDGVRIVQLGVSPKVLEYIEKDKIMLAIDQQWYLQGHLSVMGLYQYLEYGIRRPFAATEGVVDADTVKSARELGVPLDDPLGLLLAEKKGQPIKVYLNPGSCSHNPSFEISASADIDELAKRLKDLPKAEKPAGALSGGFIFFNPTLDTRIPSVAHVTSGVIEVPKRVGKKTEYVYYKDIHELEKWLEEQFKRLTLNQRVIEMLLVAMKKWRILLRPDIPSGPGANPSFWVSDSAKVDELAKFFENLPEITKPAWWAGSGGFMIFPEDGRTPWWVSVASGVIEVRVVPEVINDPKCAMYVYGTEEDERAYYKDIHGLEKWLEELYKQLYLRPIDIIIAEIEKRPVIVYLDRTSGRPSPSFEISDPAKIDELAKFFENLPKTTPPRWAHFLSGGFIFFNRRLDPRLPFSWARVARGVIEIGGKLYYKDVHGLEKWLEELYEQEFIDCYQPTAPIDAESAYVQQPLPPRDLPTSGAEPPYRPDRWNIPDVEHPKLSKYREGRATIEDRWELAEYLTLEVIQHKNNCYNYADNIVSDTFAQPGKRAGREVQKAYFVEDGKKIDGSPGDHTLAELCEEVKKAALEDGKVVDRRVPGLKAWDCTKKCEGGYYKEALAVGDYDAPTGTDYDGDGAPDRKWRDYHWYRQDKEREVVIDRMRVKKAFWSHKRGRTSVSDKDATGVNFIIDPERADRGMYRQFCGCFCRGPNMAKK